MNDTVKMKNATDETAALSLEQHIWRVKILVATYFGYVGFYLVRKVFTISKSTLAKPIAEGGYGMGFDAFANIH